MSQHHQELDSLLANYRSFGSDIEPSPDFMPKLWERIEARRSWTVRFKRLSQYFLGAAAAASLLFAGLSVTVPASSHRDASYIDVLAEAHPSESLEQLGITHPEEVLEPQQ